MPRITKVYGDLNFCARLGSTIFTFRGRPLSPVRRVLALSSSQFALSSLPIRSQPTGRGQRTIVQFFKEFETCSAYTMLHSITTLVRAVALANYYPTLARAVSRLATNDAQARQELYEHARTVLAKHLRKQDPQMSAPETIGERIAFEAAILRLEAEWQSARKRNAKPDIASQLHQHTHVWPAPDNLLIPLSQPSVRVAKLQQLRFVGANALRPPNDHKSV